MKRSLSTSQNNNPMAKRTMFERPNYFKYNLPEIIVHSKPSKYTFASHQKVCISTPCHNQVVSNRIDSVLRTINTDFVFDSAHAQWVCVTNSYSQTLFSLRLWKQYEELILEMKYTSGDLSEFIQLQKILFDSVM
jgi:hypothetical protein